MIAVKNVRSTDKGEYIGRGNARYGFAPSPLANPYVIDQFHTREQVLAKYRAWLARYTFGEVVTPQLTELMRLVELARKGDLTLLCWCSPLACHGDILKEVIEAALEYPLDK